MASNLMASDLLDIDWGRRARDILANASLQEALRNQPKRPPEIHVPVKSEPVEIREKNFITDPDSWLNRGLENLLDAGYTSVFGEGTGNMAADLAFGLTGPGSAAATIAAGNRPGVLDVLPGGGVLKAGVIAVPKALKILRHVGQNIRADELADLTRDVAQGVVNRLARKETTATREDIMKAVSEEVDGLGDFAAAPQMKIEATKIVDETIRNAQDAMRAGKPFNLTVKMPATLRYDNRGLDALQPFNRELANTNSVERNRKVREHLLSLPQDVQEDIYRRADEAAVQAEAEAINTGNLHGRKSISEYKKDVRHNKVQQIAAESLREQEKIERGGDNVQSVVSAMSDDKEIADRVRAAQREAYNRAIAEARASGMSQKDANKLASAAGQRAKRAVERELGLTSQITKGRGQRRENARAVFDKFTPEIQQEIERIANESRMARRAELIAAGTDPSRAGSLSNSHYDTKKLSEVGRIIRELGFKSPNDPRLANYEVLGRTPDQHVLKPSNILQANYGTVDDDIVSEAAEKARLYGEDPRFIEDIIRGRNAGDPDAIELYNMMFPH